MDIWATGRFVVLAPGWFVVTVRLAASPLRTISVALFDVCPPLDRNPSQLHGRGQELCESRDGRPGLPSLISLRFLWT